MPISIVKLFASLSP